MLLGREVRSCSLKGLLLIKVRFVDDGLVCLSPRAATPLNAEKQNMCSFPARDALHSRAIPNAYCGSDDREKVR
jgi:hypothetical protein